MFMPNRRLVNALSKHCWFPAAFVVFEQSELEYLKT